MLTSTSYRQVQQRCTAPTILQFESTDPLKITITDMLHGQYFELLPKMLVDGTQPTIFYGDNDSARSLVLFAPTSSVQPQSGNRPSGDPNTQGHSGTYV